MLVFLFLYKITVFSSKGKFINSATSDLSSRLSTRLTHYITTNPKFQYEKQSRLIYFDKAA